MYFSFNSNITIFQQDRKWKIKEINTIRNVLKVAKLRRNGLSIKLSNDKSIKAINFKWKGINKPTNVLSFPYKESIKNSDTNVLYLGDIILAYETLEKETKIRNIDLQKHLSHILIHGILHLKGYTHDGVDDTRYMQNEEIRILKNLKIRNPYHN